MHAEIEYRVLLIDGTSEASSTTTPDGRTPIVIEHVPSQPEALRRFEQQPKPDAVVIDQRLPGVEADVLTQRIACDPTLDGTRTVLLAADAEAFVAMPLLPSCDAYLVERDPKRGMTMALAAARLFAP